MVPNIETNLLNKERNWLVLLIGGASGTGKSSFAYELARFYGVNVLEVDDVGQALKAMTTKETLSVLHYFSTGVNWLDIGVDGNKNWLIDVSAEMIPGFKAIVDRHIEDNLPIIMEGDFIHPDLCASFDRTHVKSLFVVESDRQQVLNNFLARENGNLQNFRADISAAHGRWIAASCKKLGIPLIESRPWDTALQRTVDCLRDYPQRSET